MIGRSNFFTGRNPLRNPPKVVAAQSYAVVRNVLQIPFDDSLDSTHPLECFFQMPTNTVRVAKSRVWVQRKSFRQYVSASVAAAEDGHTHNINISAVVTGDSSAPPPAHVHQYDRAGGISAGGSSHGHVITLTPGIFETASAGTLSLKVSDDGINYSAAVVSGVTIITAEDITDYLTKVAGDRRIKIESTGLTRAQVLLELDLEVAALR